MVWEALSSQRTPDLKYTTAQEPRKNYTGYEKDAESGLEFAQARYYNAIHGRYTSIDPLVASADIKNPQTFNRYAYVMNSPYRFVDPLGLITCSFACRVTNAINGSGTLSKDDMELARFHVRNGTALGHTFLNASYAALESMRLQTTRLVSQVVTLSFSVGSRLLTVTRRNIYETSREVGSGRQKKTVKTNSETTETFEIGASSGVGECLNNPDCATDTREHKDMGPPPIGDYVLNKNKIAMLDSGAMSYVLGAGMNVRLATGLPVAPDWGSFRVPIALIGGKIRDGFYIHGGEIPGSKGCIDVGGGRGGDDQTRTLLSWLRSSSTDKIALKVTQ